MNWQRWPWIEEGALPLSVLLLRLCWLWPWLLLIARWTLPPEMRPFLPLWLMAALMLGGAVVSRLIPANIGQEKRARAWVAGLGLAAMMLALWWRIARADYALWDVRWISNQAVTLTHWNGVIPLSVAVLGLSAYLWLRGVQDSVAPNHDDIWRAFGSGFVAFVLLLLAGRIDPAGPPPTTQRWIVLFFAVGMIALALAGLRLARGSRNRNAPLPANRYWVASIVTLVIILLGMGLILALFITSDGVANTLGWIRHVLALIAILLGYVIYALAYVTFLILSPIFYWLQERFGLYPKFNPERLQNMQRTVMETQDQPSPIVLPAAVDESMRWIGLVIVLALVGLAFATALRILRKKMGEEENEVRETILSQDLLRDQAASLWQRWRERLGSRSRPIDPFFTLDGISNTRRRVRLAYQALLAAMISHDLPRQRRQTPSSYADTISSYIVEEASNVESLTKTYTAARYASDDLTDEDADSAERAWSTIREQLKKEHIRT